VHNLNHFGFRGVHKGNGDRSPRGEQQQLIVEPVIVMGWIHVSGVKDVSDAVEWNIRFQKDAIEGEALGVKSIGHGVS
jgi:pantothenate kinase-related protein Tda10